MVGPAFDIEYASFADEARRVLAPRLASVLKLLPRAALESRRDVEHVHKVRVAARRTLAALAVFAEILPNKRRRWWHKQVRAVRRAAGEARDQDVLAAWLKQRARERPDPAWKILLAKVAGWRKRAQPPIVALHEKLEGKRLRHRARKLLEKISDDHTRPLAIEACEHLRPLVGAVLGEERERLDDDAALHRLRIRVKRLRYALEIFAGVWSNSNERQPQFAGVQGVVEKMQKMLGDHNDHVSIVKRLEPWRDETSNRQAAALLDALIANEREAAVESRRQFLSWWTAEERGRLAGEFRALLGCD